MARFRATIQGSRGEASRLGHRRIQATIDGWEIGCNVTIYIDQNGDDCIDVSISDGSNGRGSVKHLGSWTRKILDTETALLHGQKAIR